ncbi:katanin p60 ATPase-containing subunit A-like 2 isoform X2 [Scyliorhinus canicula]|uniref:katanin p60 ATPase-containing subunit A-like 2 isoform X2 n=1 Tax=Scyliorhinus canicula TaxID=7830 RepID=UPI0018F4F0BC|nr:katanin p60 ATPase-containing subunit A-like 2 isoform X2 [Scyliorhinus canicula]
MSLELSYQTLKTAHQAREADEIRSEARRKNLLILILHHLTEEGYIDTANTLEQETNLGLRRFEVCDNIDLETILMEYESYYYVKFQRYPKLTKKSADDESTKLQPRSGGKLKRTVSYNSKALPKISTVQRPGSKIGMKKTEQKNQKQENEQCTPPETSEFGLNVSTIKVGDGHHPRRGQIIDIRGMIQDAVKDSSNEIAVNSLNYNQDPSERLIKPLGAFIGTNGELRDLAVVVSRDIYLHNPNVRWDDIIGLEPAKRLVKEAVVYPIKYPQLFTGILSPWKGLLLYGPPASTIVSKWRGDSEKLVRVLFELARFHAPSTIFLDELESVMSQRGSVPGGEHEGSRRMKTELLVQMDGLARSDDLVFVLAASNLPWELDHAMLRRLEKRILVDLPSKEARQAMILHWLPPLSDSGGVALRTELDYSLLGEETEGYSGSDIKLVCKEAAMRPVRKIFDALENHQTGKNSLPIFHLETVTTNDVLDVIIHTKPSAKKLCQKYTAWQHEYESV